MTTLFISDLHLDDRRPDATEAFLAFLEQEAANAEALYILGDLFEYWLGDDAPTPVGQTVAPALRAVAESGVPIAFTHGNRDFLLGERYAEAAGMTLLPEEHVIDLYGERVLLMHGDSLCTDDIAYQQFRTLVRNPAWQHEFLSKTPQERLQVALQARDASAEHKGKQDMEIMDVNQGEVTDRFEHHGVLRMIHGHTHRPATHDFEINDNTVQRIVLGDWYTQGSVLRVHPDGVYTLDAL